MATIIQFVGPHRALQLFGVKLVGFTGENAKKLLFTIIFLVAMLLLSKVLSAIARSVTKSGERITFWVRQGIHVLTAFIIIVGTASIWFNDPARLTTAIGLVSAGLAFALQRVVTALAGYVLILRGRTFNIGDRIVMGGVRGDVIGLGFLQTTIMEMGQPPQVQDADPAMWVKSRQYTGRIVSVSNAQVFDEPVFNYTRDFPFIWEEMSVWIAYKDDWKVVERILMESAERHTVRISELSAPVVKKMEERYFMREADMKPRVFVRMTDNWLELSVRFIAEDHGVRGLKDAMTRDILRGLEPLGISMASSTFELTGLPPLRIERATARGISPRGVGPPVINDV